MTIFTSLRDTLFKSFCLFKTSLPQSVALPLSFLSNREWLARSSLSYSGWTLILVPKLSAKQLRVLQRTYPNEDFLLLTEDYISDVTLLQLKSRPIVLITPEYQDYYGVPFLDTSAFDLPESSLKKALYGVDINFHAADLSLLPKTYVYRKAAKAPISIFLWDWSCGPLKITRLQRGTRAQTNRVPFNLPA